MTNLSDAPWGTFSSVRYVLTDIDDTLTRDGFLEEEAYRAIWKLARGGIGVIPVTGRPAGWCDCIARQWPVAGVIGENGAFAFYQEDGVLKHLYHPNATVEITDPMLGDQRQYGGTSGGASLTLHELARIVTDAVPGTRIAKDQFSRKFDVAIDFREEEPKLDFATAEQIRSICESHGAHAKVSSIHVNAWFGDYDKLSMARIFLLDILGIDLDVDGSRIVFCGDSPNDEPMFAELTNAVAVANIRQFLASLRHPPRYVCAQPHGSGFAELADVVLEHVGRA